MANNEKPVLGELKMTIAQFFRVNGGTTQLKGVTPDIRFPSAFEADEFGETGFDNALPWREIAPASYQAAGNLQGILPELQRRHDARTKDDKSFRELQEDVTEVIRIKEMRSLSLVEAERKQEKEAREARLKARSGKDAEALRDDGLQSGERSLKAELASEKAFKDRKDFLLEETARIVADAAVLAPDSRPVAKTP